MTTVASFERIRGRLPSLYQPEDGDSSLLTIWIDAVGRALDRIQLESQGVLQSHWFAYADRATYHEWFLRARALSRPPNPLPPPGDPDLAAFPYIDDLARLGALLPVSPWEQPTQLADLVEDYRRRIARTVAIHRQGLGTIGALRRMVEAQLPANQGAPPEHRDRPFWIEEFAPSGRQTSPAPTRGEPAHVVGPLMRWTIENDSLAASAPTVYIQGMAPQADKVDATANPMIELYQAGAERPRLGLAYADTVAAGQALRLRSTASSWLGVDQGVVRADALPPQGGSADPSAPGPWVAVAGGPTDPVDVVYQSQDLALWVAARSAAGSNLLRFDGTTWTTALSGLGRVGAVAEDGADLLIGTEGNLLRMPLYPAGAFTATAEAGLAGRTILAILRAADGRLWFGTDKGVFVRELDGTFKPGALQDVVVNAIAQAPTGVFYFGSALGLIQWQPGRDAWFWYEGQSFGEGNPDWQALTPGQNPAASAPFLPAVTAVCCHDASVWIGTEAGIARYAAQADIGLGLQTVLEAFPDVTAGTVFSVRPDPRGLLWFATDRGLFRHDGRDWWQAQSGAWMRLGRADTIYPSGVARGQWRFDRASSKWQRLDGAWIAFTDPPRSTTEPAVRAMAWTRGVVADLGQWDGSAFTGPVAVSADKLRIRVKPDEQTIVAGGIPALPAIPPGSSVWRYLSMEAGPVVPSPRLPWWSTEGRLFPPPVADAPGEGRFDVTAPPPESDFDRAVFSYSPAARVWLEWDPGPALSVLVRLKKVGADERLDPSIADRVWQGIQQVRPAGVHVRLAVEEDIVKN
jgi:hypothetical protein